MLCGIEILYVWQVEICGRFLPSSLFLFWFFILDTKVPLLADLILLSFCWPNRV
jgi:hypothetical protein